MTAIRRIFLLPVLGVLLLAGCSTVRELPAEQLAKEPDSPEHRLCRELLICFLNNDSAGFIRRLSPDTAKNFKKEEFDRTREALKKTIGVPVSFQYLTKLEFVAVTPMVWKVRFERTGRDGKKYCSEALFRIITGRAPDGSVLVIGFNFL